MKVAGEVLLQGQRSEVWALLSDERVLVRSVPGCEEMLRTGEASYSLRLKVGLAAVKGVYQGALALLERREPESVTLQIDASGATGFVQVTGRMELREAGEATRALYDWDVAVGGPVAMVGQRVLGGVAKWVIGDFFDALGRELAARKGADR
jgi:carbon monoxide dehydrogenase subunit G